MLLLKNITLYRGTKCLLEKASVTINAGEKVGLVGSNGAGKTSLFKLIGGEVEADHGECSIPNGLRIAEIRQEVPHGQQSVLDYALAGDAALSAILSELRVAEDSGDGMKVAECHHALSEVDGYTAESRAAKILVGLGFSHEELQGPIDALSGGWKMRLNLAQVLMQPCDVLLLDEPTNHLDLEAIFWLENWLSEIKTTQVIISHDRDFLDHVVERIVYVKDQQLLSFQGNYSHFEEAYAMQLEQQQSAYAKQQRQVAHLTSFVERFRYKASKARQAQSRLKMLDRMEKIAPVHASNPFNFEFKEAPEAGNPMLTLRNADIGYSGKPILRKVNLQIRPGDRIAFIGPNGAGKSTLIKALAQQLKIDGEHSFSSKIKIGYFTQHQLDSLNLSASPIWHMQELDSAMPDRVARQFLGGFNFSNERVFEPVSQFSGGEKARLALALLVWQQPNLLLLDEPSNHLDLEMRQALMTALQHYTGALILIAHDRYLLNSLIDEFYLLSDGKVEAFPGTLEDYQTWFTNWRRKADAAPAEVVLPHKEPKSKPDNHSDSQKQLDKKELELLKQQALKQEIAEKLADAGLYQDAERLSELKQYQAQAQKIQAEIERLESEILEILESMV